MKKTISLVRLDTITLEAYGNRLQDIVTHPSMKALEGNEHFLRFINSRKQYNSSFGISRRLKEQFRLLDRNRDRSFLRLRHLTIAAQYSADSTEVRHADLLMNIIRMCGNRINAKGDLRESIDINILLTKFNNPMAQEAIAALHLEKAVEELKDVEEAFQEAVVRRDQQKIELAQTPPPSSIRKEYQTSIRKVCALLEAKVFLDPNEVWDRAAAKIERANKEFSAQLKRQKTFRDKRKAKLKAKKVEAAGLK
jgi:hypothetical protein